MTGIAVRFCAPCVPTWRRGKVVSCPDYGNFIAYKIPLIDTLLQATNELFHPISLNPGYDAIGGWGFRRMHNCDKHCIMHAIRIRAPKRLCCFKLPVHVFECIRFTPCVDVLQRHILRSQLLVRFRQLQELLLSDRQVYGQPVIAVLLYLACVAGVARQRSLVGSLLQIPVELSQENDDAIQLLSKNLPRTMRFTPRSSSRERIPVDNPRERPSGLSLSSNSADQSVTAS